MKYRIYWRPGNGAGEVLVYDTFAGGLFTTDGQRTVTLSQTLNSPNGTPFPDGVQNFKLEIEDRAANVSDPFLLTVVIDTVKPNVFFGLPNIANDGLDPSSDSGVTGAGNEFTFTDRITNDATPSFFGTAEANAHVTAFVADSSGNQVPIGQATAIPLSGNQAFPGGSWQLTSTVNMNDPLLAFNPSDGARAISVVAEDVAGNISAGASDFLIGGLNIPDNAQTDFAIPVAGIAGPITDLDVKLDLEHPNVSELSVVLISPNGTPVQLFSGLAAGANLFGTVLDDEAALPIAAGLAPFTGSFQAQQALSAFDGEDPNGNWTLRVTDNSAGNVGRILRASLCIKTDPLTIFIDTQGPQVQNVFLPADPTYDLFDPKPQTDGPTPSTDRITLKFTDRPQRTNEFLYPAVNQILATNPVNYELVGENTGPVNITNILFTDLTTPSPNGMVMTQVTLIFDKFLPDDRYKLTVSDDIKDDPGNALDGESQFGAAGGGTFPTGNGQPGGPFMARFTVDARPEIGVYADQTVSIDLNGNFLFDPAAGTQRERDVDAIFGGPNDQRFATKFDRNAPAGRQYDHLAAYGFDTSINAFRFLIDTNHDLAYTPGVDAMIVANPQVNGIAVTGNFDGQPGDELGIFDGTIWYLDTTGDNSFDTTLSSIIFGYPIVGDFDGDRREDLGTYLGDVFYFDLAFDGLGQFDADGLNDGTITSLGHTGRIGPSRCR